MGNCTHSITGTVRFLQGGATLTIGNGADTVDVTSAGAFSLPTKVKPGDTYSITLSGTTPGQVCTARGGTGSGTVGTSDVTVQVVCTLAKQTAAVVPNVVPNFGFDPIPLPPVTFSTDGGETKALVALNVERTTGEGSGGTVEVGIFVDGAFVSSATRSEVAGAPATVFGVVTLAPGAHDVVGVARRFGPQGRVDGIAVLNATVLDSFETFASHAAFSIFSGSIKSNVASLPGFDLAVPGAGNTTLYLPQLQMLTPGGTTSVGFSGPGGGAVFDWTDGPPASYTFAFVDKSPNEPKILTGTWGQPGSVVTTTNGGLVDAVMFQDPLSVSSTAIGMLFSDASGAIAEVPDLTNTLATTAAESQLLHVVHLGSLYGYGAAALEVDGAMVHKVSWTQGGSKTTVRPSPMIYLSNVKAGQHTTRVLLQGYQPVPGRIGVVPQSLSAATTIELR